MLLTPCKMLVTAIFLSSLLCLACADGGGNEDFIDHAGLSGTEHNRPKDDDEFFESNSGMPNLPFVTGVMGTHGTYRFLTVVEQTAIMVGEPKHGFWRIQDKGVIREYRKKGKIGVRPGADYRSADLQDIVRQNYASYIPEESYSGYKYPDEEISKEGYLNFIDLSIYHPKYEGKYNDHDVIDLPHFFCTMSQDNYPHVWNAWKFATAQPMANKLGPLAKRAGMDIGENFLNLVRFHLFPDARIWANIGLGNNATDLKVKNLEELKTRVAQTINYQRVDLHKMDYEIYLFERPFFNVPYLYISIVMESKEKPTWSYVRNDGPYWNDLVAKGKSSGYTSELADVTHRLNFPKVEIEGYTNDTENRIHGLPVFGVHHPDRLDFKLDGGACPERGGDWGRYPWSNAGSGWPNQYQEVGPICDGILVDMKLWANLWSDWDDDHIGLGNGAFDGLIVNYTMDANVYGHYTDPYLLEKNATNPYAIALTEDGKIVMPADAKPDPVVLQLNFTREGTYFDYNYATDLRANDTNGVTGIVVGVVVGLLSLAVIVAALVFWKRRNYNTTQQ